MTSFPILDLHQPGTQDHAATRPPSTSALSDMTECEYHPGVTTPLPDLRVEFAYGSESRHLWLDTGSRAETRLFFSEEYQHLVPPPPTNCCGLELLLLSILYETAPAADRLLAEDENYLYSEDSLAAAETYLGRHEQVGEARQALLAILEYRRAATINSSPSEDCRISLSTLCPLLDFSGITLIVPTRTHYGKVFYEIWNEAPLKDLAATRADFADKRILAWLDHGASHVRTTSVDLAWPELRTALREIELSNPLGITPIATVTRQAIDPELWSRRMGRAPPSDPSRNDTLLLQHPSRIRERAARRGTETDPDMKLWHPFPHLHWDLKATHTPWWYDKRPPLAPLCGQKHRSLAHQLEETAYQIGAQNSPCVSTNSSTN